MTLVSEYQGPKRGMDRAVLLAHGAGADMHAAALTSVADALADAKIPSLRFQYPYRAAGQEGARPCRRCSRRPRARPPPSSRGRTKLPPERLVLGGRSMGGRYCSMVAADADDPVPCLGLLMLGYPLHPAGKPEKLRVEHLPAPDGAGRSSRAGRATRWRGSRRSRRRRRRSRVPSPSTGSTPRITGSGR